MDPFDAISEFFSSPLFRLMVNLFILFVLFLWFSMIYWTFRDARARGISGVYWGIVVFIFNVFGWLIYLVLRPPEILDDVRERELEIKAREAELQEKGLLCPACYRPIEKDFLVCPYCTRKLRKSCPSCSKPLKLNWMVCPYCRENVKE